MKVNKQSHIEWFQFSHHKNCSFCVDSVLKMAEGSVRTSSFRKFLRTVGINSDSAGERSSSLPSKGEGAMSASTFYSYSNEDLARREVPLKCGWLLKQSRGVLKSWQVGQWSYIIQRTGRIYYHDNKGVYLLVNDSDG